MKIITKKLICILFSAAFALSGTVINAQTKVSGTVKDTNGDPVIGAVVMLDGSSSIGTTTDVNGQYVLALPSSVKNPSLKVNCIGYVENSSAVAGRSAIDFILTEDSQELDEVVVVGYGSMRRSDLTGSVASVKINDNEAARSSSFDQLIQGHAAGVQVLSQGGSPDAGVSIRIRGLSSFNGSTEPLYVVDGIIINANQGGETLISQGLDNSGGDEQTNGLMGLNPQDIASMEILKDASATAIYGALGANGVVLITTKSATREKPVISFSSGVDVSEAYKHYDVLDFDTYCQYLIAKKEAGTGSSINSALSRIFENTGDYSGVKVYPVDWQDQCLRTAISQRYYFSISGKPNSLAYSLSIGYNDKQGIVKKTGVKQYTVRLNLDKTVSKKFKLGTSTSFAYVDSDMTQSTGSGRMTAATSLIRSMCSYRPYSTTPMGEDDDEEEEDEDLKSSPLRWLNRLHFFNSRKEFRITPNLHAEYTIAPWLTFRSTLGGDYRNSEREKFKSARINTTTEGTNGAAGTYEYFNWNWDNEFRFNKKFKGQTLSGTVGSAAHKQTSVSEVIQGWNIDQFMAGIPSLNAAPNTKLTYSESQSQTLSFFARGVYNYKNRYLITATYRADGSSKFQKENKWAYFPSFAFAWRLNQEPWFKIKTVSTAKFRMGWGRVGNQSVSNYQTLSNFSSSDIAGHDLGNAAEIIKGLSPSNLSNPALKWETTEQVNAGLDLGLWKGRLALTVDAYHKTTFDLLQSKSIPSSSGFSSIYVNEGTIQNNGLEFTLEATPFHTRDFELSVDGNLSFNRNRIVKISETAGKKEIWVSTTRSEDVVYFEGSAIGTSSYCQQTANIFMEGYPMGLFYGYKIKRIIGEGETGTPIAEGGDPGTEGQFEYYDLNGNGYTDIDDRTIIGNPNPDFTYGFGLSASFRKFSFGMHFSGSYGNDIFNFNKACETDTYTSTRNVLREAFTNAWTPENTDTMYPALGKIRSGDYIKFSSFYVEDGSYLRLANVSLSYSIPFKKESFVKNIRIGASLRNVYVWTSYSGWDPDVNSFGTNIKKMGVDAGSYPTNRTASMDLKFTF